MKFSTPLHEGTLRQRYKRFLADVTLVDGREVTAHCPNTGSMKTCGAPGDTVFLSHNPSPSRKLSYTWEYTRTPAGLVGINTARPNAVVAAAVAAGQVPELAGYQIARREVKYGASSRIDLLLESNPIDPRRCYVEVKNATLLRGEHVIFPDAVTARGLKHLQELAAMVAGGERAVMFFFLNRPEGSFFSVAHEIDPEYGRGFEAAVKAGVEVIAYRSQPTLNDLMLGERVPLA